MSTSLFDELQPVTARSVTTEAAIELRGESPETISLRAIEKVLRDGHPLIVGWSSGKDSSVLANLVLTASRNMVKQGIHTPVVITHSDTRVENPIVRRIADSEIVKIRAYAQKHSLPVQVMVGRPSISQAWPTRVIGGRALPAFPSTRSDCATDWKIVVNERNMKLAMQSFAKQDLCEPVICTGVRLGESAVRDAAMKARGERGDVPFRNQDGRQMLSPIIAWELDDVWSFLGECNAGVIEAYSDFASTIEFYRDAGGTSCVVVSDMAMQGFNKPCGARGGCWACTPSGASDRSMQNLIASDEERYGFMKPLAAIRDFLFATQYDWSRRHFVQRTIKDGYITIGADTYSPAMLAELLRYTLTAQVESGVEIIDAATLVAIDARWSLYGLHPPFEAIRIWQDIERGRRYHPPVYDKPFPKTEVPVIGKIKVGNDWDDETSPLYAEGLRSPVWEMFSESCGPSLRVFANGKVGLDLEEGLDVDPESAAMFLDWEADRKAAEPISKFTQWTSAYMFYVTLGTIQPAKGQSSMVDDLMRRTAWRQRMNLHGQRSLEELAQRCDVKFPRQADMFS